MDFKCIAYKITTECQISKSLSYIHEASAQKCDRCGAYCGGVIQLICHYEKHYGAANVQICALCHNPYVTKAALDCHLTHNHGGIEGARHDYE